MLVFCFKYIRFFSELEFSSRYISFVTQGGTQCWKGFYIKPAVIPPTRNKAYSLTASQTSATHSSTRSSQRIVCMLSCWLSCSWNPPNITMAKITLVQLALWTQCHIVLNCNILWKIHHLFLSRGSDFSCLSLVKRIIIETPRVFTFIPSPSTSVSTTTLSVCYEVFGSSCMNGTWTSLFLWYP